MGKKLSYVQWANSLLIVYWNTENGTWSAKRALVFPEGSVNCPGKEGWKCLPSKLRMNHSVPEKKENVIFEQTLRHQIKVGEGALLTPGGERNLRIKNMHQHKICHTFVMEGRHIFGIWSCQRWITFLGFCHFYLYRALSTFCVLEFVPATPLVFLLYLNQIAVRMILVDFYSYLVLFHSFRGGTYN